MEQRLKVELKRKAFHFLSFFYAAGYFYLERRTILWILGALIVFESTVEFGRFIVPGFNAKLLRWFGGIHREEESRKASGIFWTLLGSFLTMALFRDRAVVLCAMGYLIFGDMCAALVGVTWGKHKIGKKSAEGSMACFMVCWGIGFCFLNPLEAFLGALTATVIEFLPLPINDNVFLPVLSALALVLIRSAV